MSGLTSSSAALPARFWGGCGGGGGGGGPRNRRALRWLSPGRRRPTATPPPGPGLVTPLPARPGAPRARSRPGHRSRHAPTSGRSRRAHGPAARPAPAGTHQPGAAPPAPSGRPRPLHRHRTPTRRLPMPRTAPAPGHPVSKDVFGLQSTEVFWLQGGTGGGVRRCDSRPCSKVIWPHFDRVVPVALGVGSRGSLGVSVSLPSACPRQVRGSCRPGSTQTADRPVPAVAGRERALVRPALGPGGWARNGRGRPRVREAGRSHL